MKADKPLSERQRAEIEDQQAIRTALVRRHFEVMEDEAALAGAQAAHDIKLSKVLRATPDREQPTTATAIPTQAPTTTVSAPPQDLRAQLGLS